MNPPPPPLYIAPWGSGQVYGDPNDPLVSHDFSSWFSKVFAAFKRSWKSLLIIQLIASIPSVILVLSLGSLRTSFLTTTSQTVVPTFNVASLVFSLLGVLLTLVLSSVAAGASAHVVAHDAQRQLLGDQNRTTWQDGVRYGLSRFWPMLGYSIVIGTLTMLGFFLCILPGVYAAVVFYSTANAVIAFERGDVINRCFALIKGSWWEVFGRLIVVGIGLIAMSCITGLFSGGLSLAARSSGVSLVQVIIGRILGLPTAMFVSVLPTLLYAELRNKLEGVSTAQLAAASALPA